MRYFKYSTKPHIMSTRTQKSRYFFQGVFYYYSFGLFFLQDHSNYETLPFLSYEIIGLKGHIIIYGVTNIV